MKHEISLIDYVEQGNSIYIQLTVFDGNLQQSFQDEVRFLAELLYGELVHPKNSPLTESCRIEVIDYLKKYFNR